MPFGFLGVADRDLSVGEYPSLSVRQILIQRQGPLGFGNRLKPTIAVKVNETQLSMGPGIIRRER